MKAHRTSLPFGPAAVLLLTASAFAQLPLAATSDFYVSDYLNDRVVVYGAGGGYLRAFAGGGLTRPRGVVCTDDRIYVASQSASKVLVFDRDEQYLSLFGAAELASPTGMAIGPSGELYVASFGNARVCVFSLDGNFQRSFTAPGLSSPNCVMFDSTDEIFVSSAGTGLVFKFDAAEVFLTSFGPPPPTLLISPMGIARDLDEVLYVAGGSSHNIVKFATDGTFLGEITHPDLTGPQGVAFDERGHLFSSSFYQDNVVELLTDGTHVQTITAGSLNTPRSIAFAAGLGAPFCDASDGALASCPCANGGDADTGCDIPQSTGGVGLAVLAQNISPNGATVQGTGFPTMGSPTAIVIRSSLPSLVTPVVFGDGIRCLDDASGLVRLAASNAMGGISTHTFGNGAMAGSGTKNYQLWFRSTPSTFCDATAAFNLSNGRSLSW